MKASSALLQVTSFHPAGFGGGIIIGRDVERGDALTRSRVPMHVLPRDPVAGELWRVIGPIERHLVMDPRTRREEAMDHIAAQWTAPMAPRGDSIRRWISRNPSIKGVGDGYAERLWDAYGPRLYEIVRTRDVEALAKVLDLPKALSIVDALGLLVDEITALEDLDALGIDGRTAHAAMRLFGADAGRRFRDDPYLLTLLEPWLKVDAAALASGLLPDDTRRLLSAVDVAAARSFRSTESNLGGHTVVTRASLLARVRQMLGRTAASCSESAIGMALANGMLVEVGAGLYQARAPAHMEREIERSVAERLARPRMPLDRAMVAAVIAGVEQADGIRLAPEQREAVFTALASGVSAITGGAGTGKSTVVKAIVQAHARAGAGDCFLVALSGRAAKRLREATGKATMTIYRYLKGVEHGTVSPRRGLLVVDEFSMVGTPELWLLLSSTPAAVDVLFVGDRGQLPPISAGNPAAAVAKARCIPKVDLVLPQRQAASTGIPQVAASIRDGVLPDLPRFSPEQSSREGVFMVPCIEVDVPARLLEVFEAVAGPPATAGPRGTSRLHGADVQVLAMTRNGPAGAAEIGDAIERRWMADRPPVHDWGFKVGSKILWTRNSYDHRTGRSDADGNDEVVDIMNGTLGVIGQPTDAGAECRFDDGTVAVIRRHSLGQLLRGWAITVHKAQGSGFRYVIIPVVRSRLLDRSMIYTAITRAKLTAVLVGDPSLTAAAVAAPPNAWHRMQALELDVGSYRRVL